MSVYLVENPKRLTFAISPTEQKTSPKGPYSYLDIKIIHTSVR